MSETDLVKAILRYLELRGFWCWRNNAGNPEIRSGGKKRFYRGAPAGSPDVLLVMPNGQLCGIEAKSPTGSVRPSQRAWAEKARAHGVRWGLARSVLEAAALVDAWLLGREAEPKKPPTRRNKRSQVGQVDVGRTG